eukprot:TRINITY_DN27294_c0_g1_i1.p1 TRINITY_DN27294_c0_g1~~TRINITY_DN27294_c0_g1_i1.p1  ORF type:complete len:627 (+),score=76.52 TRINITY_DN27294_c0_g1_i1:66-1946(+)
MFGSFGKGETDHLNSDGEDHMAEDSLRARHHCTDIPCCAVFVVLLICFGSMYGHGLAAGNVGRLYHGIDHKGKICGVDESVSKRSFLYWCKNSAGPSLSLDLGKPICVDACPGATNSDVQYPVLEECGQIGDTAGRVAYKTWTLLDRFCMPATDAAQAGAKAASDKIMQSFGGTEQFIEEISSIGNAWPVLVVSFFVANVMGYINLVLLRHSAGPLIWVTIFAVIVLNTALGIYLFVKAGELSKHLPKNMQLPASYGEHEETFTRVCAGICLAFAGICACIACCMSKSISEAAACVEVACDAIFEMPSLLLAPTLKALGKGVALVILVYGFLLCLSTVKITTGDDEGQGAYSVGGRHFHLTAEHKLRLLFYVFMSLWIEYFLNALYEFTIGYAMAEYYYAPIDHDGEKDVGCCSLWDGFSVGVLFHMGSLAFGSFLVACFGLLQFILSLVEAQNQGTQKNAIVSCIVCVLQSLVTTCKTVVELINKNAYVDIAITSQHYCTAAKEATSLMVEMGGAMAVLKGATKIFAVFGSILIASCTACLSFYFTTSETFRSNNSIFNIDSPVTVAIASGLVGLVVALCFMLVFEMASDALLYCYGLDMRDRRPSPHAPLALKELYHETSTAAH